MCVGSQRLARDIDVSMSSVAVMVTEERIVI
jgi:hypothetical protein